MRRTASLFCIVSAATLAALVIGPSFACGPNPTNKKKPVKVTLVVIRASYKYKKTDERLTCIAKQVGRCCKKLKGFRVAVMTSKSLPVGKATSFQLIEKQIAQITIRHGADERDRVSLTVVPPKVRAITYRTVCGKFLPIVTPYHAKNGDRLILAIRVQPCNGGKE